MLTSQQFVLRGKSTQIGLSQTHPGSRSRTPTQNEYRTHNLARLQNKAMTSSAWKHSGHMRVKASRSLGPPLILILANKRIPPVWPVSNPKGRRYTDAGRNVRSKEAATMMDLFFRWLPIGFKFNRADPVEWLDFGGDFLSDPFFTTSVNRLINKTPPALMKRTSVKKLIESAARLPSIAPSGIIFHISRCGSTLLTNVLGSGKEVVVLSEPPPIKQLVYHSPGAEIDASNKNILDALLRIYANKSRYADPKIVIKCQPEDLLKLARFRSLWPEVPFLIIIRDPIEVIVSNLARPGGWMTQMIEGLGGNNIFGYSPSDVRQMTVEEFSTKAIAAFLCSAIEQLDDRCWVVDYRDITPENIHLIAALFGLELPSIASAEFQTLYNIYAKDASRTTVFQSDIDRKQSEASDSLRNLAALWTTKPYSNLRSSRCIKPSPDSLNE